MELPADYESLDAFRTIVDQNLHHGTNLKGKRKSFIHIQHLEKWWRKNLSKVLQQQFGQLRASKLYRKIKFDRHTKLLSILAYSCRSNFSSLDLLRIIDHDIDDYRLPLPSKLHPFDEYTWQLFEEWQWMFCPIRLETNETFGEVLDSRRILPGIEIDPPPTMRTLMAPRRGAHDSSFKIFKVIEESPVSAEHATHLVSCSYNCQSASSLTLIS